MVVYWAYIIENQPLHPPVGLSLGRALHDPEEPESLERTIPREVRDAFVPLWEMYRTAHKTDTGKKAPRLPD